FHIYSAGRRPVARMNVIFHIYCSRRWPVARMNVTFSHILLTLYLPPPLPLHLRHAPHLQRKPLRDVDHLADRPGLAVADDELAADRQRHALRFLACRGVLDLVDIGDMGETDD